jgi:hypothetical protein
MPSYQPTAGDVHVSAPLTQISIAYTQQASDFVADAVFPNVPVQKQADRYYQYAKGNWFRSEARVRAPGSESAGSGFEVDATPNYYAPVLAVHKDVDDQIRANADAVINPDRDATEFVTQQLLLKRDIDWASKYFAGNNVWTGSTTGSDVTPSTLWSAPGSTPIEDMTAQIFSVKEKTGFWPNVVALGAPVWKILKNHATLLSRIQYTQRAIIGPELLAAVLGVDKVVIAGAVVNSAIEGAADSLSFIMGKHVLICYAEPRPSLLKPSAGYTFSWTGYLGAGPSGQRIKRFRMEHLAADRVEGEMAYDQKLVAPELGAFMKSVVA